jgi:hypothetical protein
MRKVDATLGSDGQSATMKGTLASLPSPITFDFQARGKFFSEPTWSADLTLKEGGRAWVIACAREPQRFKASGQSKAWRWDLVYELVRFYSRWDIPASVAGHDILIEQWNLETVWESGATRVTHAAVLGGGQTEFRGTIALAQGVPVLTAEAAAKDVDVAVLERAFTGGSSWSGRLTGIATSLSVALSSPTWTTLQGDGSLEIKSGAYKWPESLTRSLTKAKTMRYFQKKYPELAEKGLPFESVAGRWSAKDGMVTITNGSLRSKDLSAGLVGRFDAMKQGMDGFVRLQLRETNPALLKEIPEKYLFAAYNRTTIQPIYGRFQGTLKEWYLKALRASNIPAKTQNQLKKALNS